jgi:serine protease Do
VANTDAPPPALIDLLSHANAAVVTIINTRSDTERLGAAQEDIIWGSGVIIDPAGYVLTNYHVASRSQELVVVFSDATDETARFITGDHQADLALLKIDARPALPVLPWGDSGALRLGQGVIAISLPNTVTTGIVSGLDRMVMLEDQSYMVGLIQTDAAINWGNSGGALLNERAELVGIVTLIVREMPNETLPSVQGIGFAIPSAAARPLVEQWITADQR